jgi:Alcohol dehydrogenase GroES-like domain
MAKMGAVQVARAGGPLELVEREMPEPTRAEVRIRVDAWGVCHSDSFTVEGQWPNFCFPRIPGARDCRRDRRNRRRRFGLAHRAARRRWLVWRALRALRAVPAWLVDRLPQSAHTRHFV